MCERLGRKTRTAGWTSAGLLAGVAAAVLSGASVAAAAVPGAGGDNAPVVRKLDANEVQARARYVRVAGLFGDDEEEKAQQQHEQTQDATIQTLNQRVGDLEESLRRVTGQMEEMNHRMQQMQIRMDRMQKDFEYRLCTLTQKKMGSDANDIPCDQLGGSDQGAMGGGVQQTYPAPGNGPGNGPDNFQNFQNYQRQGALTPPNGGPAVSGPAGPANGPAQLGKPPGVLGTLPADQANAMPPPMGAPQQQGAAAPVPASRNDFDTAMNLLAKARYDEARAAFRSFADTYPKDDLAPQAVYWMGDIAYVQKDYPEAARSFAEELKKYPKSPRAPESMLKLGQSLLAMNQKQEGCTALGALPSKYPTASKSVLSRARDARKQAACR